jgi:hypothetical protein
MVAASVVPATTFLSSSALAQSASDLVGTWTLVSSVSEKDGTKTDQFGAGAKGTMVCDASGHFMLTIIGADLPKFSSNNRAAGTPEENKAVVSKSIAMIGDYSVNASDKTLTVKESSTSVTMGSQMGRRQLPLQCTRIPRAKLCRADDFELLLNQKYMEMDS